MALECSFVRLFVRGTQRLKCALWIYLSMYL